MFPFVSSIPHSPPLPPHPWRITSAVRIELRVACRWPSSIIHQWIHRMAGRYHRCKYGPGDIGSMAAYLTYLFDLITIPLGAYQCLDCPKHPSIIKHNVALLRIFARRRLFQT